MLRIAVPSVLQQSTVSIGMMIVQAVVNPFGTQALAGYAATMRVENVFSLIFVSIGNAVSPFVSQNLGANKTQRIKKGYHAALVLDVCFAALAFLVIETLHTQISSLFLGKDGTALAVFILYLFWLTMALLILMFSLWGMPNFGVVFCVSLLLLNITILFESLPGIKLPSNFATLSAITSQVYEHKFRYVAQVIVGYFMLDTLLLALMTMRVKRMDIRYIEKE